MLQKYRGLKKKISKLFLPTVIFFLIAGPVFAQHEMHEMMSPPMTEPAMALPGEWSVMSHGFANGVYDRQSGPRGSEKAFSTSMYLLMAQRQFGAGQLGLRGMFSLDPLMGADGYPELLQTGETADGINPLIDRQHPHDFFMELASVYEQGPAFVYLGWPGEPALGPTAYMHRASAGDNPEAPLSHHWLDSTHIVFGVATLGLKLSELKLEGSVFKGREPDQYRWDIEPPKFDSYSFRVSGQPAPGWSWQASYGFLKSPEQLEPNTDVNRYTFSVSHDRGRLHTTFAFGRNEQLPGVKLDAYLLESAAEAKEAHNFFGRFERVEKNELFPAADPRSANVYTVHKASVGYIFDFIREASVRYGLGASLGINILPAELEPVYGRLPLSFLLFVRAKLE
jgi:hypothetical protein